MAKKELFVLRNNMSNGTSSTATHVRIEGERLIRNLDFPAFIDHSWMCIAENLHASPFKMFANRARKDACSGIKRMAKGRFLLSVSDGYYWTDGRKLSADDVCSAVGRGARFIPGIDGCSIVDDTHFEIECDQSARALAQLLSSPFFSITPSLAGARAATVGPYQLTHANSQLSQLLFSRRQSHPRISRSSPDIVHVVVPENKLASDTSLSDGRLDIGAPLGVCQRSWMDSHAARYRKNRPLDVVFALSGFSSLDGRYFGLRSHLATWLCCRTVSEAMSGLTTPYTTATEYDVHSHGPRFNPSLSGIPLVIYYTEYEPNRAVANEISHALNYLGIASRISEVSYESHLHRLIETRGALMLDILVDAWHGCAKSGCDPDVLPVLRANSCFLMGKNTEVESFEFSNSGVINWSSIKFK